MYEYEFARIELAWGIIRRPLGDYQETVREHAAQGWRVHQFFAPPLHGYGKAAFYDLIFEREKP